MAQTCVKCSRVNPSDAVYCYYDGMVLNGHGRAGGPIAVGSQQFNSPFVFPSGKQCRTFNELALACQDEWAPAKDMLQQGFLGSFLGGLGRMDLAMAAKQAAAFPDPDRGLDELLGKLPADVLQPPRLSLETQEINLGNTPIGTERKLELKMENMGGRLLYGTITCPDGWISFGDQPGINQKTFQFTHEYTLPVKLCGDRLRASNKPIETQLVIDSSGGTKTIVVRAEVPVKPFPAGLFGGAKAPRQVAEKAKANAKTNAAECAALFERGDVRKWYKDNGWTYPVQGRDASGLGAVQQFFEALGLTPAPKVECATKTLNLSGNAGQKLQVEVVVKTEEKKPVYADGTCDEPWIEIGKAKLAGRVAHLPLTITVPNTPGQLAETKLTVLSNGNQKFFIPIKLQIGGSYSPGAPPVPARPVAASAAVVAAAPVVAARPIAAAVQAAPPDESLAFTNEPAEPMVAAPSRAGGSRRGGRQAAESSPFGFVQMIPAGLLLIAVLAVVIVDIIRDKPVQAASNDDTPKRGPEKPPEKPPVKPDDVEKPVKGTTPVMIASADPMDWKFNLKDPSPKLLADFSDDRRFGLHMPGVKNPTPGFEGTNKQLTRFEQGQSNNTIIKIDDTYDFYFGKTSLQNKWSGDRGVKKTVTLPNGRWGMISEMDFTFQKIKVTQHVEIVPSKDGLLDTCLVYYKIKNYGTVPHKVAFRALIDTFIGTNDGVPFTVPGQRGFLTTMKEFPQKDIPDYVEAVENPNDVNDQGTVVRMTLKGLRLPGVEIEDIERMAICRWPDNKDVGWDFPIEPIDKNPENKDSCVVLYWGNRLMNPGDERHLVYTYGLSRLEVVVSGGATAKPDDSPMALSVPTASIAPNGQFFVTAYLWNTKPGQKVKIDLPAGLELPLGETVEKTLTETGKDRVQISWKVNATSKTGTFPIKATSGDSTTKPRTVDVKVPPTKEKPAAGPTSIFG